MDAARSTLPRSAARMLFLRQRTIRGVDVSAETLSAHADEEAGSFSGTNQLHQRLKTFPQAAVRGAAQWRSVVQGHVDDRTMGFGEQ